MTTKICAVCETAFTVGGGKGPKSHPVLCSAHYFRFRRGSKSWKDPSIRGVGVDLARVRISQIAASISFQDSSPLAPSYAEQYGIDIWDADQGGHFE